MTRISRDIVVPKSTCGNPAPGPRRTDSDTTPSRGYSSLYGGRAEDAINSRGRRCAMKSTTTLEDTRHMDHGMRVPCDVRTMCITCIMSPGLRSALVSKCDMATTESRPASIRGRVPMWNPAPLAVSRILARLRAMRRRPRSRSAACHFPRGNAIWRPGIAK
jgi:hypothetical protein